MLAAPDRLQKLVVDLEIGVLDAAAALQDRVSGFCRARLPAVLDGCLAEFGQADRLFTLDRLELNLGALSLGAFEDELTHRLTQALREALRRRLPAPLPVARTATAASTAEPGADRFAGVAMFLERGVLPTGWRTGPASALDEALLTLLREHPVESVALLRDLGRKAVVRSRLARQFCEPVIHALTHLLAPGHGDFVIDFAREVAKLHARQPLLERDAVSFGKLLWEGILTHLLLTAGVRFDAVAFVADSIRQLAAGRDAVATALLARVVADLRALSHPFCAHYALEAVLDLLQAQPAIGSTAAVRHELVTEGPPSSDTGVALSRRRLGLLSAFLEQGVLPWSAGEIGAGGIDAIVAALIEDVPAELLALVRRLGQREAVRLRLASQLQDRAIERLVALLEPRHARIVLSHVSEIRRIQRRVAPVPAGGRAFRAAVWQFVLTYLLVERGSQFNRREFIKSTLAQMAARYRLSYAELLLRLVAAVRETSAKTAEVDPLGQLLLSLSDELYLGTSGRQPREPGTSIRAAFADIYTEADLLAHWMRWGRPPDWSDAGTEGLERLVQRVLRLAPDDLVEVLTQLADRARTVEQLATAVGDTTLRRLLAVLRPGRSPARQGLARALQDALPARAPSTEESADRALASKAAPAVRSNRSALVSREPTRAGARGVSPADALARLLVHGIWPDEIPEPTAVHLAQWLLGIVDTDLEWALRRAGGSPQVARRIARQLPTGLFPRVIQLLAGSYAGRLLAFQEDLRALHAHRELGPIGDAAFAVQVREYVLAHLLAHTAGPFVLTELVRSVLAAISVRCVVGYRHLLAALGERTPDGELRTAYVVLEQAASAEPTPNGLGSVVAEAPPPAPSPLDGAIAFLLTGRVPIAAEERSGTWPSQWLADLLDQQPAQLVPALQGIADRPDVIRRLLHYVAPAILDQLIAVLVPTDAEFVRGYLRAGASLEADRSLPSGRRRRVAALHWQSALTLLLDRHAASFSREAFVARASSRIAQRLGLAADTYATRLLLAARTAAETDPDCLPLVSVLAKARGEEPTFVDPTTSLEPGSSRPRARMAPPDHALSPSHPQQPDLLATTRDWLRFGTVPEANSVDFAQTLEQRLVQAFRDRPAAFRRLFLSACGNDLERLRIAFRFSPSLHAAVLRLLLPQQHRFAVASAEALSRALLDLVPSARAQTLRAAVASDLLRAVHEQRGRHFDVTRLVRLTARRAAEVHGIEPLALLTRVGTVTAGETSTDSGGLSQAVARLQRALDLPAPPSAATAAEPSPPTRWVYRSNETAQDALPAGEAFYLTNAGLVLLWPFLTRYFDLLGLLDQSAFVDESRRSRAVYLLQYLATGSADAPEPELLLNKILCGMDCTAPPEPAPTLTEQERQTSQEVLHAVTQNWSKLRNTSIGGLRDSFLVREGRLLRKDDAWSLTVEARAYDVLLDTLPWRLSTIRLPWMQDVLYVSWR